MAKASSNPDSPASGIAKFIRLTREQDRKTFYASLKNPKWWMGGKKRNSDQGWLEVFQMSSWKCIFCGRDLAASTETIVEATEEHLVPRSLLEPNGADPDMAHNMAACCSGCNVLKGEFIPESFHPCWKSRQAYVKECFRFISGQRLKNYLRYRDHIENVLRQRAGE